MFCLNRGCFKLVKRAGQVLLDFNSHLHALTPPVFRGLIYHWQKAGREQHSGMLKSSMMGSVNSANGSRLPRCLACFIS